MRMPPTRDRFTALLVVIACLGAACTGRPSAPPSATTTLRGAVTPPPTRPITCSSPDAQRAFDEGMLWMYSFNHDEAVRCFEAARRADPACAMANWGIAICRGPHINAPMMDEASSREAWAALQRAQALSGQCTDAEKGLIEALSHRYADPDSGAPLPLDQASREPLDRAYARAMGALAARWPEDDDIQVMHVEALMDLRPWDLWTNTGEPRPETPVVVATLETVLARNPTHAGANHYFIHAIEGSPSPERAAAAADRLRTLVPGSGHMVHMPSHIDVRTGRWNLAADQNIAAIEVDEAYRKASPRQGLYRVYMLHDQHFLSYACMMAGRSRESIAAARAMLAAIPDSFHRDYGPFVDPYTAIEIEALVRFGRWDEVLALDEPRSELPITRALWRYARGVALAAKGDPAAARRELAAARESSARVPHGARMAQNSAAEVLSIADAMLEGEIAYRDGDLDSAVSHLRSAVEMEDRLRYIEPPDWVQPVRHTLGAILLDAGRTAEAEAVYREDLRRLPENGWSLRGLAECCRALGRSEEAAQLDARFAQAWSRADISPGPSCLCVPRSK